MTALVASFPTAYSDPTLKALYEAARRCFSSEGYRFDIHENHRFGPEGDKYAAWDALIASGKGYLCGEDMPLAEFLATHTSALTAWQKLAYEWCRAHPDKMLRIYNSRFDWHVYQRGESICFDLPHHDAGGEKGYASRDGKTKVLINRD